MLNLSCWNLNCPNLSCRNLNCPNLSCRNLNCPNLNCSNLSQNLNCQNLSCRNLNCQNLNRRVWIVGIWIVRIWIVVHPYLTRRPCIKLIIKVMMALYAEDVSILSTDNSLNKVICSECSGGMEKNKNASQNYKHVVLKTSKAVHSKFHKSLFTLDNLVYFFALIIFYWSDLKSLNYFNEL